MTEREQEILSRYAHWREVIENHSLQPPMIDEYLEIAGCDGQGGCIADSCSGGNGSGCLADSCSAGGGKDEYHKEYIHSLVEKKQLVHT